MAWEDRVFIANVVVTDPMWETMASSVISRLVGAITKFSAIAPQV
jgi:hypothetical protein